MKTLNQPKELTRELIFSYSHLPLHLASLELQVDIEVLKKKCKDLGMKKWPYNARKEMKKIKESQGITKINKRGFYQFQLQNNSVKNTLNFPTVKLPSIRSLISKIPKIQ